MKVLIALLGAMVAFPSSRGLTTLKRDWVEPTLDMIKTVYTDKIVSSWSSLTGYKSKFAYMVNNGNDRGLIHNSRDLEFTECDKVQKGFLECAICLPCEKEVAVFDSCGFMTGRDCMKVDFIKEITIENCKIEGKEQDDGDEKCASVTTNENSAQCPEMPVCEPIKPKQCVDVFPKKTSAQCAMEAGNSICVEDYESVQDGTACNAGCSVWKCLPKQVEENQCNPFSIEGNPTVKYCRVRQGDGQCNADKEKCIGEDFEGVLEDRDDLKVEQEIIKCSKHCESPFVETSGNPSCAKTIKCKVICPKILQCPGQMGDCFDEQITSTFTDDCGCTRVNCTLGEKKCISSPPEPCGPFMTPARSLWNKNCECNDYDVCKPDPRCLLDACCTESNCCVGPDANEDTCCPKDENGCLLNGNRCLFKVSDDPEKWKDCKDADICTKECRAPYHQVKPNPMCCYDGPGNPGVCKTEPGECKNLQNCCDGCCKMEKFREWVWTGPQCPPPCDESGVNYPYVGGKSNCYMFNDTDVMECPEGSCCCRSGDNLEIHDCPPQPTPISVTTTQGPPEIVLCSALEDPYSNETCCRGVKGEENKCCVKGVCCPGGKACCQSDTGRLHVVGEHCCKGDGCCAMYNANEYCCNDADSCCKTGCFTHCKIIKKNGEEGFLDQKFQSLVEKSQCACRESVIVEKCTELDKEEKPLCHTSQKDICTESCERDVCKVTGCSANSFVSYLAQFAAKDLR